MFATRSRPGLGKNPFGDSGPEWLALTEATSNVGLASWAEVQEANRRSADRNRVPVILRPAIKVTAS